MCRFIISCCNPAIIFQSTKHALDDIALFIAHLIMGYLDFAVCADDPCRHTTENADFKAETPVSLSCEIFGVARVI